MSPKIYAETSILAQEAGEEMLSRLDWMTIKPDVIVDIGCGTGAMSLRLQTRFKEARVLAMDLSLDMLQFAINERSAQHADQIYLCSDAAKLPLSDDAVDLIFANFLLPWHQDVNLLLHEWQRVLRPGGLLMLTALGPDTLQECRSVFHPDDLPKCVDMHDLGDTLLQAGFADPVLDVNYYTLVYREKEKLISELYGSRMISPSTSEMHTNNFIATDEGTWPLTYEVIYAHAFMPEEKAGVSPSSDGIVRIPLTQLRRQLTQK